MANVRPGFNILQLAIGLAIIAVLGAIVAPNLFRRVPLYERQQLVAHINAIARVAWIGALKTGHVHKITFNNEQRMIRVYEKTEKKDFEGKDEFKPVMLDVGRFDFVWDDHFEIKQFYVEGVDEFSQHATGNTMQDVWFFVVPEGMAQEAIINILDTKDTYNDPDGQELGLVLNPFSVYFEDYETFQHPSA